MAQQRLPIVNSDDGVWGDILRQYLMKEHYNDDTDNAVNGGHQFVTIRAGTTTAAPLTLTSGSLLSTPAIGAIEFNNDTLYFTKTTGATRMQLVTDTATQILTNKTLTTPKISQINDTNGNEALILGATASAVNEISITNAATTVSPSIAASGNDTNISIELTPKGTGRVKSGGVIIPTISSADILTNKTINGANNTIIAGMLAPVQACTLNNETFTISGGTVTQIAGTTINGYSPAIGDRILITGAPASTGSGTAYVNTTQPANGIYTVTSNTTNLSLSRSADMSGSINPAGLTVFIKGGTWNASNVFSVVTPTGTGVFTYGTDNIGWQATGGYNPTFGYIFIATSTNSIGIWNGSGNTYVQPAASAGNQTLTLPSTGTDTLVSRTSADTLTNKTLTAPKINVVNDTAGNTQFTTSPTDMIMAVDLDMEGRFVWNIHDPTDPQDATSKIYVDNLVTSERTAAATLTNKTLSNPTVTNYTEQTFAIGTVTTAATISLANGTVQTATLTASTACTFTMPAVAAGKSFVLFLKQAASTGLGTATFTGVKWPGGTAPTITPTAGQMDILTFTSDGTNWYGTFIQGFTP